MIKREYLILLLLVMIVLFMAEKSNDEGYTTISNESLQNLSSLYNNGNLEAANVTATGTITSKGNVIAGGTVGCTNVDSLKNITAKGTITGAGITSRRDITADGNLGGTNVNSRLDMNSSGSITAKKNITASNVVTGLDVNSKRNMNATGTIKGKDIVATGNTTSTNLTVSNQLNGNIVKAKTLMSNTSSNDAINIASPATFDKQLTVSDKLCMKNGSSMTCFTAGDLIGLINSHKMKDIMYENGAVIYNNIYDAISKKIIKKNGNPKDWNDSKYKTKTWNGHPLLAIGNKNNVYPNGLHITVPKSIYDKATDSFVIWIRILNDIWGGFDMYTSKKLLLQTIISGYRNIEINPNGSIDYNKHKEHKWVPFAIQKKHGTTFTMITNKYDENVGYISGIAFSTNPWNNAVHPAITFYRAVNGSDIMDWKTNKYYDDIAGMIKPNKDVRGKITPEKKFKIPVIPSDHDKLVYIIESNDDKQGIEHTSVTVNGTKIENFRTSYANPFATHYNSKQHSRYYAAKIPKKIIKSTDKFITININTSSNKDVIYVREMGTHDYI